MFLPFIRLWNRFSWGTIRIKMIRVHYIVKNGTHWYVTHLGDPLCCWSSLTGRGCKLVCLLMYNCEVCVGFSLGSEPCPIGSVLRWWEWGWEPGDEPGAVLGGNGGGEASRWFGNESLGGKMGASGACLICNINEPLKPKIFLYYHMIIALLID